MAEEEICNIPEEALPLATVSSDANALFSLGIRWRTRSTWNHFMWMHKPCTFASQGFTYGEQSVKKYFGTSKRLKFWHNPHWTPEQKKILKDHIQTYLDKPAFSTRYDWLAIIGQAIGIAWFQNPFTRICSEYGSLLRETGIDPSYDLKTPSPDQVEKWFQNNADYSIYGRYAGE
jgi:hypothetical protein